MKEKSKEHSLKEMKLIMTCLTIICFCCTFITIFQKRNIVFRIGNQSGCHRCRKSSGIRTIYLASISTRYHFIIHGCMQCFYLSDAPQCKAQSDILRANANLIYYIGLIIEFNGILQAILNEFAPVTNPRQTYMIYILIGVFIIFIGYLFQIGIRMKEEQELTI